MIPSLVDTDILSEFLKRRNTTVLQNATNYLAQFQRLSFSAVTRYEIRRGYLSRNATASLQRFEIFCQNSVVFPITNSVLDQAASLWAEAQRHGMPDNDADLIIAATALTEGRSLVTGNTAHFAWIPNLALVDWRQIGSTP